MPGASSIHAGSDHGPAGSVAVTTKLPCRPSPPTSVQATKNRPAWWRIVGANSPPERRHGRQVELVLAMHRVAHELPLDEVA